MSYCLSINTNEGLVLCASSFNETRPQGSSQNMYRFIWPGNRFFLILASGNATTINAVLNKVRQDINSSSRNLLNANSLGEATDYIADVSVQLQKSLKRENGKSQSYFANFIVAGQIQHQKMETSLIYAQGNYIHESKTSPFLQIGETKFGKPILDRIAKRDISLSTAARCALVSVDSTIHSNPINTMFTELFIYKNNSLEMGHYLTFDESSVFFNNLSQAWGDGIITALEKLPRFYWE